MIRNCVRETPLPTRAGDSFAEGSLPMMPIPRLHRGRGLAQLLVRSIRTAHEGKPLAVEFNEVEHSLQAPHSKIWDEVSEFKTRSKRESRLIPTGSAECWDLGGTGLLQSDP